ncbi:Alpha/Beta hydrolase protein [Phaeosphaeriaceae sp. PMI808]|nr:Alpha/Beta hydrolase protein [Phaeosphaeriaceae sp. PMI808]
MSNTTLNSENASLPKADSAIHHIGFFRHLWEQLVQVVRFPCIPTNPLDLKVYIWVHDSLKDSKQAGILIDSHGGGMKETTGHPLYSPWLSCPIMEATKKHGLVLVSWERRMMPESNGQEILKDTEKCFDTLLNTDELQRCLDTYCCRVGLYPSKIILTAESAGATPTLLALLLHARVILGALLQSPLAGPYKHDMNFCRDKAYSQEELYKKCHQIIKTRSDLGSELPYAKSRYPGLSMESGFILAASKYHYTAWGTTMLTDLLDSMERLKDNRPSVCIIHGSGDTFVPFDDSVALNEKLQKLGFDSNIHEAVGEEHCFDRDMHLISPDMVPVAEWFEKTCS